MATGNAAFPYKHNRNPLLKNPAPLVLFMAQIFHTAPLTTDVVAKKMFGLFGPRIR